MVQQPHRPSEQQAQDFYSGRDNNWHQGDSRNRLDVTQEGRFSQQQAIHPRVLPVEAALKDCAGLSVREFALFVLDENGDEKTYSSTSLTPYQQRIFNDRFRGNFRRTIRRASQASYPASAHSEVDAESDFQYASFSGGSSSEGRKYGRQSRSDGSDDDDYSTIGKRKRSRPSPYTGYGENDDTPVPVPTQKTMQLVIGNEAEVERFYFQRFKDMQQSSCKVMGKAFVKLVEPKKQTHHPYTKGDEKAPSWWPLHADKDIRVRHKEPDHLLKPERIRLLVHILRMIIMPVGQQHPAVQKLVLNVKKLEEATLEVMAPWFNAKEHPENAAKRPYFKEIFKVAKQEERFRNGEIDATTRIPVICGDRNGQDYSDDDEPDEGVPDDDDDHLTTPSSANMSPDLASPPMMQSQHPQPHNHEPEPNFRQSLPLRRYPRLEDPSPYADPYLPRSMNVGFQAMGPVHDVSRRSFQAHGFHSPQQQQGAYSWSQPAMVSQAPGGFYVTSPQSMMPPHSGQYQLPPPPVPQPMLPPPLAHSFDVPNNGRFDSGPALGHQLRTGSLGHPHHMSHHGFPEYIPENHGQAEPDMKNEHMYQN